LCTVQRCTSASGHTRPSAFSRPAAPSMMTKPGAGNPRETRSSSRLRHAASLSPPMLRTASNTFCPSRRMPSTTSSEIDVALRSSRTRTTVPSRISRTTSSSASERRHHAVQSVCTFRQVRLTVSFDTAPLNSAPNALRTRRVLVPDRYAPAIRASTCSSSAHSVAAPRCAIPGACRRLGSAVLAAR